MQGSPERGGFETLQECLCVSHTASYRVRAAGVVLQTHCADGRVCGLREF